MKYLYILLGVFLGITILLCGKAYADTTKWDIEWSWQPTVQKIQDGNTNCYVLVGSGGQGYSGISCVRTK